MKIEEDEIINRWLNGDISEEEARESLPEDDIRAYKQILNEVDKWIPDAIEGEIFDVSTVMKDSASSKPAAKVRKLNIERYLTIAASVMILLAAGIAVFSFIGDTSYIADEGKFIDVQLPDGKSHVVLSPGSRISWARSDWDDDGRKMLLKGKAFFTVHRGSPFIVESSNGTVEVLGTEFEMASFGESFIVACYRGKVRAKAPDDEITTLTAGKENHYHNGTWNGIIDANGSAPTWIKNQLVFQDTPLREVIAKLEKTYDLKIDHTGVNTKQSFTGALPTNNMDVALQLVFPVFNITYKLEGHTLTLSE